MLLEEEEEEEEEEEDGVIDLEANAALYLTSHASILLKTVASIWRSASLDFSLTALDLDTRYTWKLALTDISRAASWTRQWAEVTTVRMALIIESCTASSRKSLQLQMVVIVVSRMLGVTGWVVVEVELEVEAALSSPPLEVDEATPSVSPLICCLFTRSVKVSSATSLSLLLLAVHTCFRVEMTSRIASWRVTEGLPGGGEA